jgi:hypothetical protein
MLSLSPGIVYMLMPACLLWAKPRITMYPPGGSSVADGVKIVRLVHKQAAHLKTTDADWEAVKPTNLEASGQYDTVAAKHKPGWISWDDDFVDELRTTLKAFWVFSFLPLWYMADGGTNTILRSRSTTGCSIQGFGREVSISHSYSVCHVATSLVLFLMLVLRSYSGRSTRPAHVGTTLRTATSAMASHHW